MRPQVGTVTAAGSVVSVSVCICFQMSCGGPTVPDVHVLRSQEQVATRDLLVGLAHDFYTHQPDRFDFLVFWASPDLAPASSYYLPVRNDVAGIGYRHVAREFFDDGPEFGSRRLQGVIWIGPSWRDKLDGDDPDSILGTLAHETAHRWCANVHFVTGSRDKLPSADLLGEPFHWSFYLDTGASPLRGNRWERVPGGYRAEPVDITEFCPLDLYLMGLIASTDVPPLALLRNVRNLDGTLPHPYPSAPRVTMPLSVSADVQEVAIEQVIAAEGARSSGGFDAVVISQAWIYVASEAPPADHADLLRLREMLDRWPAFFSRATGGRSVMTTS